MKRLMVERESENLVDSMDGCRLDDVAVAVDSWRKAMGDSAVMRIESDRDGYIIFVTIAYSEPETDAEMAKRQKMIAKRRAERERAKAENDEADRKEWERLRAKFGSGGARRDA